MPGRVANVEKAREYLWRLADVYDRMACFPHAEAQLRELMEMNLSKEQRLEALCFLADIQVGISKIACTLGRLPNVPASAGEASTAAPHLVHILVSRNDAVCGRDAL